MSKQRYLAAAFLACGVFGTTAAAQESAPQTKLKIVEITKTDAAPAPSKSATVISPDISSEKQPAAPPTVSPTPPTLSEAAKSLPSDVPDKLKTQRRGQLSEEEAAVVPYYNSFLANYYLGPEDVISVEVFGQPNYSKVNITVPPNGRISYPLVKEGVFVAGKSVEQIAEEITKKLDEYIIDPKVTVSLDRAVSARYSVLGDVAKPGAQIMTRRLSVYEAIAEAGGILQTGDKKQVIVLRSGADGRPYPIPVNLKDIEKGKAVQTVFLVPGDQIIVPGNKIKAWQSLMNMLPIVGFARGIFTGGF